MTPDEIICSNAGDSRTIMCQGGKAVDLSVDHRPEDETEKARIEAAGIKVIGDRVNGTLKVARAIGDTEFKVNKDIPQKD